MIPGMNPRQMQGMMKKLGIQQKEIDAEEVIIKLKESEIVIKNPQVSKINMMGQETFQVIGEAEEREKGFEEGDVVMVMEQASCSRKEAIEALRKSDGDIAKAIVHAQK